MGAQPWGEPTRGAFSAPAAPASSSSAMSGAASRDIRRTTTCIQTRQVTESTKRKAKVVVGRWVAWVMAPKRMGMTKPPRPPMTPTRPPTEPTLSGK